MFWVDAELGSDIYLDGIVSVVDAKYGLQHLREEKPSDLINEAARQIALADLVIINKTDLVSQEALMKLKTAVKSINGLVKILETQRSRVDIADVLDLHAFDSLSGKSFQQRLQLEEAPHPHLDKSIVTSTFEVVGSATEEDLNVFVQGLVSVKDKPHQVIIQGVHELYDLEETTVKWTEEDERTNRFVLIGRNLDKDILKDVFITTVTKREENG
ncbi:hypothetical protein JD844_009210 [Phrynosoma platyrhinos]|uniref:COBW domain-containing protein 3 n=1 Tax=Phrynosoma platyrhinos TaxID=52577 RepID=A0ABQ7TEX3_PHRPL|nr:hypothetical protein JD844_009210 [Phrynosoma platyrhinos]